MQVAAAFLSLVISAGAARSGEATIAVAANFTHAAERLIDAFETRSDHEIILITGSTGKLYAQITLGAPFDLFLSADSKHPALLEGKGLVVPGSRFTYAIGRLVVLSKPSFDSGEKGPALLTDANVARIAIANPDLAPYGEAAMESMEAAGIIDQAKPKLIIAETVGQVYAFVQTSNVELGFVALSQVINSIQPTEPGRVWLVPQDFHSPIRQDAVLTGRAAGNPAAEAFHEFLQGDEAKEIVAGFGYDFPPADV